MNEVPVTPLLEAKNIKKYFKLKDGRELHAVDNVSFSVYPGKTLGLVGESGCGKKYRWQRYYAVTGTYCR